MTTDTWITVLLALIGNAAAFGVVLLKLGAIGQRLDLLWAWYLAEHGFERAVDYRTITPRELRPRGRRASADGAGDQPGAAAAPPMN